MYGILLLSKGSPPVKIFQSGFQVNVFGKSCFFKWSDVEYFEITREQTGITSYQKLFLIKFKEGVDASIFAGPIWLQKLYGPTYSWLGKSVGLIPLNLDMDSDKVLRLLNEYKERYSGPENSKRTPIIQNDIYQQESSKIRGKGDALVWMILGVGMIYWGTVAIISKLAGTTRSDHILTGYSAQIYGALIALWGLSMLKQGYQLWQKTKLGLLSLGVHIALFFLFLTCVFFILILLVRIS